MTEESKSINQDEEIVTYNRLEKYIPKEYAFIDRTGSWKKCRCGRIVPMSDHWCGRCGQKIGIPDFDD